MKRSRLLFAAVAVAVAATAAILFLPPPAAVTRAVVLASSDWILTDYMRASGGPRVAAQRVWRKFAATYADHGLAVEFHRHHLPKSHDDAQRIAELLTPFSKVMVNQLGVRYLSTSPVFASGLGACDQLNGAAAHLLAIDGFTKTQVVGIVLPHDGGRHSIGRAWSKQRNEWLYFDVWPDYLVVFRAGAGGRAEYLARTAPMTQRFDPPSFSTMLPKIYDATATGFVHNEFAPTFGGYLWLKMVKAVTHRTIESIAVAGAAEPTAPRTVAIRWPSSPLFDRAYLEARLQQLRGDDAGARSRYLAIAASAKASSERTHALLRAVHVWLRELGG